MEDAGIDFIWWRVRGSYSKGEESVGSDGLGWTEDGLLCHPAEWIENIDVMMLKNHRSPPFCFFWADKIP